MIVVCAVGLGLLLYPTVADYWNRTFATHAISTYAEAIEDLDTEQYAEVREEAIRYNRELSGHNTGYVLDPAYSEKYQNCLNVTGDGLMGFVEIPRINVQLPLFHGTSDRVLQSALGHVEWSSLPVGGEGTHCVISGHRGLASAKLLTDLDELREGDTFTMTVLDDILTYEVDQIRTVLPDQVDDLAIDAKKDLCTIVTCTPYGINTHRLLVRGHRVGTVTNYNVVSEAVVIDPLIVAVVLAMPLLFILLLAVLLKKPESAKQNVKRRRT